MATVGEDIHSDGRRSYLRVKLDREDGRLIARLTGTQSSGALMSMVQADGLLIVPEDVTHVGAGERLPVRLLRDFSA
jgi:molybdopterin molybdotransferase